MCSLEQELANHYYMVYKNSKNLWNLNFSVHLCLKVLLKQSTPGALQQQSCMVVDRDWICHSHQFVLVCCTTDCSAMVIIWQCFVCHILLVSNIYLSLQCISCQNKKKVTKMGFEMAFFKTQWSAGYFVVELPVIVHIQ